MKRLLLVPLLFAAVVAGGMLLRDPMVFYRSVLSIACLAAGVSAIATSGHFTSGDRLHATWIVFGLAYVLAFLRHGYRVWVLVSHSEGLSQNVLEILLILQNVLLAAALWMFVRTWRVTGLAVPASRRSQITWTVMGIALALVVGGYPLILGVQTAGSDLVLLVSTLGDVIGMALIVPLLMPALAMRGGVLAYTWAYLAASEIAWLCYDIWLGSEETVKWPGPTGRGFEEIFRIVAVAFALIASLAQRRAAAR